MQSVCAQSMIKVANGFIFAVSEISFEAVHAEIINIMGRLKSFILESTRNSLVAKLRESWNVKLCS